MKELEQGTMGSSVVEKACELIENRGNEAGEGKRREE